MLADFDTYEFAHGTSSHPVHRGGSGPPVLVVHEIPGITPEVAEFAERVAADGFTVYLPELFGTLGRPISNGYLAAEVARVCISREFRIFAARRSSPIVDWLRALAHSAHRESGGLPVGAIGMCVTGNFALTMMVDPWLMAPILSQPSLPVDLPGRDNKAELHITPADLETAKRRAVDEGVCVLGLRFTNDKLSPPQRFDRLAAEFGDRFERVEIDSSPGNPHGLPADAHSVVTTEFVDEAGHPTFEAMAQVLGFLHKHLDADRGTRSS